VYTESGYRVIGLAQKQLHVDFIKAQKIARDEVEKDIHFLGYLVMQNKLKQATTETIKTLNNANIRTIMATGDNVLTAISVGRECNIIDEETEVFLGDTKMTNGEEVVFWKSTKN
jgi:cation-transporting ATPase 13A2